MKKRMIGLLTIGLIIIACLFTGCENKEKVVDTLKVTETKKEPERKTEKTTQATELPKITEPTKSSDAIKSTETSPITEETKASVNSATEAYKETAATIGYVLYVEGSVMYLDEENTGGRTAPGEGEERATDYDLSNAVINAPGGVRKGLTVDLIYYIEDGMKKALEVNSDGDEKEPMVPYELPSEIESNINVN